MRDIALNSTAYFTFCAYRFDTGAPAAVDSIAIQAYPNDSATQITSGITITQPDSITGYYNVAVAATVANGYAAGTTYSLVITTGTVNSVSVVGTVVGEFGIRVGTPGLLTTGIAQAGAAGTVTLATNASATADIYNGATAVIVGGTGVGQVRQIYDYSTGRVADVSPNWVTTPDTTSVIEVYATPPSGTVVGALPEVNAKSLDGNATAFANLVADYDGTGYAGGTINKKANATQVGSQTASASGTITFPNGTIATAASVLTTALTEAYAADGAEPTLTQALYLMMQMLGEFSVSGVTMTVKKLDGSTSAATFTLNDATNPTSITRAT